MANENYRVEFKHHKIICYQKTPNENDEIILWEAVDLPLVFPTNEQQLPEKIDINRPIKHYHDLDTAELYTAYMHIVKIIKRMDEQSKHRNRNVSNYHGKWGINDLRSYCQIWIDNVRGRQDFETNRWWVFDRIKYFFRGQLKQRIRWIQTFGTICFDLSTRLDAIDGGNDDQQQENQTSIKKHEIGF